MNWYKRVCSAYERTFTVRQTLQRLKAYGIILIRSGDGSHNILKNLNNNKYTNFCFHNQGQEVLKGKLQSVLKDLEIDYNEFIKFKRPKKKLIEEPIEEPIEESWKKDKWYQEFLKSQEPQELQNI